MQPTPPRSSTRLLHGFDARSLVLFATLTMGGTQAVLAQSANPPVSAKTESAISAQQVERAPLASTLTAPTSEQAFERADANGDGKLTLREAERYPAVAERFGQFDRDQNGSLSRDEFTKGIQQP